MSALNLPLTPVYSIVFVTDPTSVFVPVAWRSVTSSSTNPSPPTVTSGFLNSVPSYALLAVSLANVTFLFVIVSSSIPVNSPIYFSLVTRIFTVLLSLTFVAVISDGSVVQLPSAFLYSILILATSSPVTVAIPATWALPSYVAITLPGINFKSSLIFAFALKTAV